MNFPAGVDRFYVHKVDAHKKEKRLRTNCSRTLRLSDFFRAKNKTDSSRTGVALA